MSKIKLTNQAAPDTPAAGKTEVYVDNSTKKVASKDDSGTVTNYGSGGGGGGDVYGPASSVDLDIAVFSGVTGKLLADGGKKTADFILHSLATAVSDFLCASGAGVFVKKTLAETKTILGLPYTHPNHSGEVTSAGDGAQTIAADAVTYAKMQNVSATDKLLGRATAGAGDVEEIACTAAGRAVLDDADAAAQRATLSALGIAPRITSTASSATPTPNADTTDMYILTAQAAAATFGAPTGTPSQGQKLIIRVKDNATARALSWNAIYRALGVALPTTTTISKTLYVGFIYNSTDTKWDCVTKTEEA